MGVGTRPLARSEDLIVEELGEELLVYDAATARGHCLSPTAARVWQRCDGRTDTERLSAQLDLDANTVDHALEELAHCDLLERTPELTVVAAPGNSATRREVATKFIKAGAAAAAAPLIVSVAAPTPAQAQSILPCDEINNAQQCANSGCCPCDTPEAFICVQDLATCCMFTAAMPGVACGPGGCPESTSTEMQGAERQLNSPPPSDDATVPAPDTPPAPETAPPVDTAPAAGTPPAPTPGTQAPGGTPTPGTESAPTP